MSTVLYDKIIFGPIHSRRLGISLGVNLLSTDGKICSFNCIYCECGLNEQRKTKSRMPTREEVHEALYKTLSDMKANGPTPDVITFAGNGEPTLHPDFGKIIDDTIEARNHFFPQAKVAVLSNSTMIFKEDVFKALNKVDDNILKFDSVLDSRIHQMNAPTSPSFTFKKLLEGLCKFNGNLMIQTMFLRGEVNGKSVDNTTEEEVNGWLEALKQIHPKKVMVYTLDRETPVQNLLKVSKADLEVIADKARALGFEVSVSA